MNIRINELTERLSERLSELKALREMISESGDSDITEMLLKKTDRMYAKLSEELEELSELK